VDVVGLGSGVASVSAGGSHSCAVTTAGAVKCWGWNVYGELGNGTTTISTTPVDVVGLGSGVASVSAGFNYSCAVTTAGAVKCWGRNDYGELGDGTTTTSTTTPVDVVGLGSGVASVSAGFDHSCAVTTGGAVKCWGNNGWGVLGDGTTTSSTTPVGVVGLGSGAASVSAGGNTCAVTTAGAVKCWGWNFYGDLGDGTTTSSTTPVDVVGLGSGVASVSAGGSECAVTTAGAVKCWGWNVFGELGDGTTTDSTTPVDVVGLDSGVASISTGGIHSCAVTTAGAAKCWGGNGDGALGDGTITSSTTPVDVVGLP
jgi:alpha-tubulin suppressor-like RCC1 family protein